LDTTGGDDSSYESVEPTAAIVESGSLSHKVVTTLRKYNPLEKAILIKKGVEAAKDAHYVATNEPGNEASARLSAKHARKYFELIDKKKNKTVKEEVILADMLDEIAANSWVATAAVQRHKELAAKHKSVAESEASKVNHEWQEYHEGMVRHYKSGGNTAIPKMPSEHDPMSEGVVVKFPGAKDVQDKNKAKSVGERMAKDEGFKKLMRRWARSPQVPRHVYDSLMKTEGFEFAHALFENVIMAYGHKDGSRAIMAHYRKSDNADRVLVSIHKPDGTKSGVKFGNRNLATSHLERRGFELHTLYECAPYEATLEEGLSNDSIIDLYMAALGETVEVAESVAVGDIVVPNTGPHKNQPHRVIHIRGDGKVNIKPILRPREENKYRLGAASADPGQIRKVTEGTEDNMETKTELVEHFKTALREAMTPAVEVPLAEGRELKELIPKTWKNPRVENAPGFDINKPPRSARLVKVTHDSGHGVFKRSGDSKWEYVGESVTPAGEFAQAGISDPLPINMTPQEFDNPASEHDTNPGYVVDVQYINGKMVKIVRMGTYLAPMKVVIDGVDWRDVNTNDLKTFYGKDAAIAAFHAAQSGLSTTSQELNTPEADKYNK
jgi:hypothetical protein